MMTEHNPFKVLAVDDDPNVIEALRNQLTEQTDMKLVASATSVKDAMKALSEQSPDVMLVDLGLPDGNGLDLIRYASGSLPQCEIMVLTVFGDESHVLSSIEAGASGYLTKDTSLTDVANRLRQLRAGGSPISPVIARGLLNKFRQTSSVVVQRTDSSDCPPLREQNLLSERETEVLQMVAKGFMQAEIAELIGVSVNTIGTYVKRIYKKLAVNSRTSAIHKATVMGILNQHGRQ